MPISHGLSRTPEYKAWKRMRCRCNNPGAHNYKDYGGRGITVCDRWDSFENFLSDMGPRPSAWHSVERNQNDGDYEPGNCVWATKTEQARNRRSSRFLEIDGVRLTLAGWAERFGQSVHKVHKRLKRGWTITEALERP